MRKLSIIIPAYNAHNTIVKTLESIAVQLLNYDFEVLIVNDASDYTYEKEVSRFSKFFDIKELVLKENGGPGVARRKGLENTSSEYILFIDSDDYLYSPYSLAILLDNIIHYDSDMLISNFIYERDNERKIMLEDMVFLHGKIYKRKFLDDNNITFNDTRANEDNGFNRLILLLDAKVTFIDEVTYVYQENANSITRKENRKYKLTGLEWFAYNIKWAIDNSFDRVKDKRNIYLLVLNTLTSMYCYYIDMYDDFDVQYILRWSQELYNEYYKKYNYTNKEKEDMLEDSKKHCLNQKIKEIISFDEFLERVEKYND